MRGESAGTMKLPRDVLPGAYAVMEQELHGDSMVPHWSNVREEGERRVPTTSSESDEIKVRYVTRTGFYNVVEWTEHGNIIRTI